MEIRLALTRKTTRRTLIWFVTGILMLFVRVSAKTSSYTMDAILVFHGYNRLLCIDVYLPDYGSTSSMRPNHICTWWMAALLEKAIWFICQLCIAADRWFTAWSAINQIYSLVELITCSIWRRTLLTFTEYSYTDITEYSPILSINSCGRNEHILEWWSICRDGVPPDVSSSFLLNHHQWFFRRFVFNVLHMLMVFAKNYDESIRNWIMN